MAVVMDENVKFQNDTEYLLQSMKLDILSRRMMTERQGLRIRTCVTFKNKLRRFYVSIFQLEGLQASQAQIEYVIMALFFQGI